ncbi:MAG: hypothetical protein IPM38_05725 [Ignavibacteria bacterium]|nr:hypothetical protein [Ignavibacteria bacterium]
MKNLTVILVFMISLVLKSTILFAENRIYVHPILGVDAGNEGRNIGNPLKTLYRAGQVCHGGDTIFIRGGSTYIGFHDTFRQIDTMGLTPVWIMPYFNETVILDGAGYNFQSWKQF